MSGWREEAAWAVGDVIFVLLLLCSLPLLPVLKFASMLGGKKWLPHPGRSHQIS